MAQIKLAGSRTKRPSGARGTVRMPVTAARGTAARMKSFQAIPVERAKPSDGGNGRSGNTCGKSCDCFSGTSRGCSGRDTLICGAPHAGQKASCPSRGCPQRWQSLCIYFTLQELFRLGKPASVSSTRCEKFANFFSVDKMPAIHSCNKNKKELFDEQKYKNIPRDISKRETRDSTSTSTQKI